MPADIKPEIAIRDITSDDVERVHHFIVREQGEAEFECDERYIDALIKKDWLRKAVEFLIPIKRRNSLSLANRTTYAGLLIARVFVLARSPSLTDQSWASYYVTPSPGIAKHSFPIL